MSITDEIKQIKTEIETLKMKISIAKTKVARDVIDKEDLHRLLEQIEELL